MKNNSDILSKLDKEYMMDDKMGDETEDKVNNE